MQILIDTAPAGSQLFGLLRTHVPAVFRDKYMSAIIQNFRWRYATETGFDSFCRSVLIDLNIVDLQRADLIIEALAAYAIRLDDCFRKLNLYDQNGDLPFVFSYSNSDDLVVISNDVAFR